MSSVTVIAAGVTYHLKPWYRPGLPALTGDGELLVADEGTQGFRQNLISILQRCHEGSYEDEIPAADIESIERQANHWLCLLTPAGPPPPLPRTGNGKDKGLRNNYEAPPTPKRSNN